MIDVASFMKENETLLKELRSTFENNGIAIKTSLGSTEMPSVGSSLVNGIKGLYFKVKYSDYLSRFQKNQIKDLFPIKIVDNDDIYSAHLLSISDYDWDDDRDWPPSILFTLTKNGKDLL